ncbi:MAG: hypothetical protein PWQ55_51 [Chloroflexota bacterium]|nr:hypothetical protein [Chloroflexota bacterium]
MRKIQFIRKVLYLLAVLTLVLGLLPLTHIHHVFADDGGENGQGQPEDSIDPTKEPAGDLVDVTETAVSEASQPTDQMLEAQVTETAIPESATSESTPSVTVTPDPATPQDLSTPTLEEYADEQMVEQTPTMEITATNLPIDEKEVDEEVVFKEETEENNTGDKDLSAVVSYLNEESIILENDAGETISFSSNEGIGVLSSSDPFFWNPSTLRWEGYSVDGTGCPTNVTCFANTNPFQAAVDAAPSGSNIYVAQNTYDEDVVVNTQNLSFVSFSSINVVDASNPVAPTLISGYSTITSLTLNADFGTTSGVYANKVIVNSGGKLDDGLNLVNVGGEVEASVKIYSADGHYRVEDANDSSINYEWECGEPDMLIYPGRVYRMVFKGTADPDILEYYTNIGDETGQGRSTVERIDDLLEGIKRSELENWNHTDEERIFWYLLGQVGDNGGLGANGTTTVLNPTQFSMATAIINRYADTEMSKLGVWFLWPILENSGTDVSPLTRQLTFMHYITTDVYGCTDMAALNYNPLANTSDGSCQYDDPGTPSNPGGGGTPQTTTTAAFIPVTAPSPVGGLNEELFLIPVTGVDYTFSQTTWQRLFFSASALLFGVTMILEGITHKRKI